MLIHNLKVVYMNASSKLYRLNLYIILGPGYLHTKKKKKMHIPGPPCLYPSEKITVNQKQLLVRPQHNLYT